MFSPAVRTLAGLSSSLKITRAGSTGWDQHAGDVGNRRGPRATEQPTLEPPIGERLAMYERTHFSYSLSHFEMGFLLPVAQSTLL